MNNALAKKFSFPSLILFAFPNMIMMVFLSMYTIVDGIFISRYAGTLALSATNMVYPFNCIEMAVGIMFATGASAVIAKRLGERKEQRARENFTFIVILSAVVGCLFCLFGTIFLDQIVHVLGTSESQFPYARTYAGILICFSPAFFLQTAFQTLFVTAGKPHLGLAVTVCAGLVNMVLDYVFLAVLDLGVAGAAYATGIGYLIPSVTGILYFRFCKKTVLHFTRWRPDWRMFIKTCGNGSSEMVTNIANAATTFLFNMLFLKYYGEDGVASITIVLYFQFVFAAVFFGFSMGVSPVISFKYGAQDTAQLRQIVRYCLLFTGICSVGSYTVSRLIIRPALSVFTEPGGRVFAITMEGFGLYALSFLLMGISIFASALFTALSNGMVSACISFARTFIFLVGMLLLLPLLAGRMGIWLAVPTAELLGIAVSVFFLLKKRKDYGY